MPGVSTHSGEKLIEVPLGEVDLHATIVLTVGIYKFYPNIAGVNTDPVVGISDATNAYYHGSKQLPFRKPMPYN